MKAIRVMQHKEAIKAMKTEAAMKAMMASLYRN